MRPKRLSGKVHEQIIEKNIYITFCEAAIFVIAFEAKLIFTK